MKKEKSEVRNKMFVVRLNQKEEERLNHLFKESTCRKLSTYGRKVLLQTPVHIKHRNQSADEILSALLKIKKELNAIGNNYNQVVHRLHTIDKTSDVVSWLRINERDREKLVSYIGEIKNLMQEIHLRWSQK